MACAEKACLFKHLEDTNTKEIEEVQEVIQKKAIMMWAYRDEGEVREPSEEGELAS